jgi:hypothetical protein
MNKIIGLKALLVATVLLTVNSAPAQSVATNLEFSFPPNSLGNLIWTNFIAHTNGRSTQIWSTFIMPTNFPHDFFEGTNMPPHITPTLAWNTNCLIWGMKGETALSQCWTAQGARGQVPITALTRRHGYTRGHSMGNPGITSRFGGQRVYFCTTNNQVIEMKVRNMLVNIGSGYDYTILFFTEDLPPGIEPLRVADMKVVLSKYPYPPSPAHWVTFLTEQTGNVSANCAPFVVDTWKGGDSGSPNLLPLPGELVFYAGRSTSGPSPQMQADMDALSRSAGLDPAKYQMQWVDLSSYPTP